MDASPQTFRLETRYVGQKPGAIDLKCRSFEWVAATWHDVIRSDGPALRSIIEGPCVIASGLPDFDADAGWNWMIDPEHGEHEITNIEKRGGEVKFVLRPSPGEITAIMGPDPRERP
jgi:hypothetical protein